MFLSTTQLRADSDVKFFAQYVDSGTQAGFDAAKNLYYVGANFRPRVIVSVGGSGTTFPLVSSDILAGQNSSGAATNVTPSTGYLVGSTNLTLNYAKGGECVQGALLPPDRVTRGCTLPPMETPEFYVVTCVTKTSH
jgi:hypothetical protein